VLVAQLTGQLPLVPLHTYAPQLGEPAPVTLVQVPFAAAPSAAEHTSHEPPQPVSQQNPSTQLPLEHWLLAVHAVPCAFFAVQVVPLQ
jgi:hypothetical protein